MDHFKPAHPDGLPRTLVLSAASSALWEDDGPDGDDLRRAYRMEIRERYPAGARVEIYSHDGITLDVVEVTP